MYICAHTCIYNACVHVRIFILNLFLFIMVFIDDYIYVSVVLLQAETSFFRLGASIKHLTLEHDSGGFVRSLCAQLVAVFPSPQLRLDKRNFIGNVLWYVGDCTSTRRN